MALDALPDGAMVAVGETAFLTVGGRWLRWRTNGYETAAAPPATALLLTPPRRCARLPRAIGQGCTTAHTLPHPSEYPHKV
jgi:hypothetical protein